MDELQEYINPFSDETVTIGQKFDEAIIQGNEKKIKKIILEAKKCAETENDASQAQLFYSIATAYSGISNIRNEYDESLIKNQLYYFRKSIDKIECQEYSKEIYGPYVKTFKCVLYTNYGNVLYSCGKIISAIEQYKKVLIINPNFGMAMGNLGKTYREYAMLEYDVGHFHYLNHFAYYYLIAAVNSDDPNVHEESRERFKNVILRYPSDYIEKDLKSELKIPKYSYDSLEEREYRDWVLTNNLFLNSLNDLPPTEYCFATDVIGLPNMTTSLESKPVFHGIFNQIKQEYIYARYLYYSTLSIGDKPHFADKDTYLFNLLDYSHYSIRIEKLKTAYKTLCGLFDKIAYFINFYFKLGIQERDISFSSIWEKEHGGKNSYSYANVLKPKENFALLALYWTKKDFFDKIEDSPNPYLHRIREIRNALEHKYVKVTAYSLGNEGSDIFDDLAFYVSESELYDITFRLLKILRESIISLSLCVNIEEIKKKNTMSKDTKTIPFLITNYDDKWKV